MVVVLFFALSSIPVSFSQRFVTLDTIDIFTTHELFNTSKPTVYFRCNGEGSVYLPDVKEANFVYTFKGKESWQPLTELPENKCKQCGLYGGILIEDTYDDWELCSSDFKDGKCTHFKQGQFRATFLCPNCTASNSSASAVIVIIALFGVYKYCHRKRDQQDQSRSKEQEQEQDQARSKESKEQEKDQAGNRN
ncbi:hypothetical protein ABZP36_006410 [Zizania latifolia]